MLCTFELLTPWRIPGHEFRSWPRCLSVSMPQIPWPRTCSIAAYFKLPWKVLFLCLASIPDSGVSMFGAKHMFCRGKTRVRFLAEQQHRMHTIYWHVVDFIRRRHVCDQWNPEYFILYPTEHPPTYTQPCTTWKVHCELCGDETETTWHFWHFCTIPEERTPNPAFEILENF